MMPMTSSIDMECTFWENSRTTEVMSSDPAKAARISVTGRTLPKNSARKIRVMPTTIFAPEEMPSTKGPAMGLRKNTCSR